MNSDLITNAGSWDSLSTPLSKPIRNALSLLSFDQMTPVQSATIPLFLKHKDVIVEAVTGSGKTLAFIIPVLEILLKRYAQGEVWGKHAIGAIILSPTRELAKQIFDVTSTFIDTIHAYLKEGSDSNDQLPNLSQMLFIGGTDVKEDIQAFQKNGAQILIGTPGRLEDLLKKTQIFKTKELEVLVLDEADRLLDMGFEQSLNAIMKLLPRQRRTGLFSATMNDALNELVRAGLRNPVKVVVKVESLTSRDEQRTPSSLNIFYLFCNPQEKLSRLFQILNREPEKKYIIYFATGAGVDFYYKVFSNLELFKRFSLFSLHGKMDPKRREAVYTKFTNASSSSILICTDIAARGLDIPDIDWVIQYDPPQDPKSFAHRCGRTARLGRQGNAVVFLNPKEDTYVEFLKIRKVPMQEMLFDEAAIDPQLTPAAVHEKLLTINKSDRDVYEKSIKAFVSWVRSYHEHQASFIFNLKNVDLGLVAKAFGLFRLPKMPELKSIKVPFENINVDVEAIPYKDPTREKQRIKKLEAAKKAAPIQVIKKRKIDASWSQQKDLKEKRLERREKKERRRIAIAKVRADQEKAPKKVDMDDWLEMQEEARKLKKSKKAQESDDDI